MLNVAMHLMLTETKPEDRQDLVDQLTGPFRTMGTAIRPEDVNAPAWWHGEEDAYESTMAALERLPRRR